MNFDVEILETLSKTVSVDAHSEQEAISIVKDGYRHELYILSADDYCSTDFIVLDKSQPSPTPKNIPYFSSSDNSFKLYHGDCIAVMKDLSERFDMIFADPPYFLSNGGISCQSGQIVSVNKGEWDISRGREADDEFNRQWLQACRSVLKDNGTIWISGTYHNIFSVANNLTELGYKILNVVTWAKTNPPPNISCRFFTYSTEFVIWARKCENVPHYYNYELMKQLNGNKQMTDVWHLPAIAPWEKTCGKHPTQKPLKLLHRIILASTKKGDLILDPFSGSATTGIAANLLDRQYVGIDLEQKFLDISLRRKQEISNPDIAGSILNRLGQFKSQM